VGPRGAHGHEIWKRIWRVRRARRFFGSWGVLGNGISKLELDGSLNSSPNTSGNPDRGRSAAGLWTRNVLVRGIRRLANYGVWIGRRSLRMSAGSIVASERAELTLGPGHSENVAGVDAVRPASNPNLGERPIFAQTSHASHGQEDAAMGVQLGPGSNGLERSEFLVKIKRATRPVDNLANLGLGRVSMIK
jgi:hypothetical protein